MPFHTNSKAVVDKTQGLWGQRGISAYNGGAGEEPKNVAVSRTSSNSPVSRALKKKVINGQIKAELDRYQLGY